jgi:hypothetical protein
MKKFYSSSMNTKVLGNFLIKICKCILESLNIMQVTE